MIYCDLVRGLSRYVGESTLDCLFQEGVRPQFMHEASRTALDFFTTPVVYHGCLGLRFGVPLSPVEFN